MTQIPALPTLKVEVAFAPSDIYLLTNTFTDVTQYIREFQTRSGRQHFLDRVESSSLDLTFDNRSGFFSSGSTVLGTRMPIKITATWNPSGTIPPPPPYPIYYGVIDTITERVGDYLNLDLAVHASDFLKFMSLRYMNSPKFWEGYVKSSAAIHWYDCDRTKQANIVSAVATTTVVTYTYAPGTATIFSPGDKITITGLTTVTGPTNAYNLTNVTVASVGTGYFTVNYTSVGGRSLGQATVTKTTMTDLIGSSNAELMGYGTFTNNGAMVYRTNTAIDLANGSTENTNCSIQVPAFTGLGGVDFWINGAGLALSNIILSLRGDGTYDSYYHELSVDVNGRLILSSGAGAPGSGTRHTVTSTNTVNDGYWHHVGIVCDYNAEVKMYCDGVFYTVPISPGEAPMYVYDINIGTGTPCLIDEIVFSDALHDINLASEVQKRYRAGSLLQLGFPTTGNYVYSGDRIAEILCLAEFGTIVGGSVSSQATISLTNDPYFINGSSTPWSYGASGNGYTYSEPYYWDSPVTASTALDLIGQVCDTDIGSFFQTPDGKFAYYNQLYYGTWVWNDYTQKGTWTLNTFGQTTDANHTWTDNDTGVPYFGTTLQIVRDDVDVWTIVKVTPQAGTDQIFEHTSLIPFTSQTYQDRWGHTTLSKSGTLHTSLTNALSTATYLGLLFQEPKPRVGLVELRAETANGTYIPAMLGADLGDPVNFKRNPTGASASGSINANYIVESIQHSFLADPGQWHTSFTLDPYPLAPSTTPGTYFPT